MAVRLHLLMCRSCARYVKELVAIGTAARRLSENQLEDEEQMETILRRVLAEESRPESREEGW
jgi:hypothetical protein